MLLLLDDPHMLVEKVPRSPVVIARRKATEPTIEEFYELAKTTRRVMDGIDRAHHGLLVDLRPAKLRTDPELDRALAAYRAELLRDFPVVARLVISSVGILQGTRLANEDKRVIRSFLVEDDALVWLRDQVTALRSQRK